MAGRSRAREATLGPRHTMEARTHFLRGSLQRRGYFTDASPAAVPTGVLKTGNARQRLAGVGRCSRPGPDGTEVLSEATSAYRFRMRPTSICAVESNRGDGCDGGDVGDSTGLSIQRQPSFGDTCWPLQPVGADTALRARSEARGVRSGRSGRRSITCSSTKPPVSAIRRRHDN